MKRQIHIKLCIALLSTVIHTRCLAHDDKLVHPAMFQSAANSSSGLPAFLVDYFGRSDAASLTKPKLKFDESRFGASGYGPLGWLKVGSRDEDGPTGIEVLIRTRNHFYDPTKEPAIGLTDGWDEYAVSSFTWATAPSGGATTPVTANQYTWLDARACEFEGLVNANRLDRERKIAEMLYIMGHVIHLNQDLTVPAHVRNDNHALGMDHVINEPNHNCMEKRGEESYIRGPRAQRFPLHARGWLSWRDGGFQRVEDFWDRNLYLGQTNALNEDARSLPGRQLGLAEFCNGNFISDDARYVEYHRPGEKHYFPFPSLLTSTTFPAYRASERGQNIVNKVLTGTAQPAQS